MEKTPLEIKELLSADILNVNFYKLALKQIILKKYLTQIPSY